MHRTRAASLTLCLAVMFSLGCSHTVNEAPAPGPVAGPSYSVQSGPAPAVPHRWWESFGDPRLNEITEDALRGNYSIRQAAARLNQAAQLQAQAGVKPYPLLMGKASSASSLKAGGTRGGSNSLLLTLSWELDLWRKLSSAERAASYEAGATRDDLEATALLITFRITETYLRLVEQKLWLALLEGQIDVSNTFLRLVELRFSKGASSLVDIYQQRQQLSSLKAQRSLIEAEITSLGNRLNVLMGTVPDGGEFAVAKELPGLPEMQGLGVPADLLLNRPDLRGLHKLLVALDYRVAEAVADRLPGITLGGSAGFSGNELAEDGFLLSMLLEAVAPVLDWGAKKSEVQRRKARVEEYLAIYSEAYLTAIEEVENALALEARHKEHISALTEHRSLARATLSETRRRYTRGQTDYLPVLDALQSLQAIERDLLQRRREVLSFRALLYRALGGAEILGPAPEAVKYDNENPIER